MGKSDPFAAEDGRLSAALAATLEPRFRDALDHPVRRDVLRALNRGGRARSAPEIGAQVPFGLSQVTYHLQVLRRSGAVVAEPMGMVSDDRPLRYASEVLRDAAVRTVLGATERWDARQREAAARKNVSPLLTMFRVPRPTRTIKLRGRGKGGVDRNP